MRPDRGHARSLAVRAIRGGCDRVTGARRVGIDPRGRSPRSAPGRGGPCTPGVWAGPEPCATGHPEGLPLSVRSSGRLSAPRGRTSSPIRDLPRSSGDVSVVVRIPRAGAPDHAAQRFIGTPEKDPLARAAPTDPDGRKSRPTDRQSKGQRMLRAPPRGPVGAKASRKTGSTDFQKTRSPVLSAADRLLPVDTAMCPVAKIGNRRTASACHPAGLALAVPAPRGRQLRKADPDTLRARACRAPVPCLIRSPAGALRLRFRSAGSRTARRSVPGRRHG